MKRAFRQFWVLLGRVLYWLSWPGLWLVLSRTERTRVLVIVGDQLLLVRTWHGDGKWGLPGGGLKRHEPYAVGAQRELREETAVALTESSLNYLGMQRTVDNGIGIRHHFLAARMAEKPLVHKEFFEIEAAEWFPLDHLPSRLRSDVRAGLELFRSHPDLLY